MLHTQPCHAVTTSYLLLRGAAVALVARPLLLGAPCADGALGPREREKVNPPSTIYGETTRHLFRSWSCGVPRRKANWCWVRESRPRDNKGKYNLTGSTPCDRLTTSNSANRLPQQTKYFHFWDLEAGRSEKWAWRGERLHNKITGLSFELQPTTC